MLCLSKYEKYIDFIKLAQNQSVPWNYELIELYHNKININWLIGNHSVQWTFELLDKYKYYLDWKRLSTLQIKWSDKQLKYFVNFWDWETLYIINICDVKEVLKTIMEHNNNTINFVFQRINRSPNLHKRSLNTYDVLLENIQLYKSQFSPEQFVEVCYKLIHENKNIIEWDDFSLNTDFPWSIDFIKQYRNYFNWKFLSNNASLPWNVELVETFREIWDWKVISRNEYIPWTNDIIEYYEDKLLFDKLSLNESINWNIELIEKYKDRWDWRMLSLLKNINWNTEILDKFTNNFKWCLLVLNKYIYWTPELIKRYENKIIEYCYHLSTNPSVEWTIELVENYKERWDWQELSKSPSFFKKINDELAIKLMISGFISESSISRFKNNILYDSHLIQEIVNFV